MVAGLLNCCSAQPPACLPGPAIHQSTHSALALFLPFYLTDGLNSAFSLSILTPQQSDVEAAALLRLVWGLSLLNTSSIYISIKFLLETPETLL